MKLLGNLLLVIGLIFGCLAAATAYSPRTDIAAERLEDLHMTQPAGARPKTAEELEQLRVDHAEGRITGQQFVRDRERPAPLVEHTVELDTTPPRTDSRTLDAATVETLKSTVTDADGAEQPLARFVRVREFSFSRWPHRWMFVGSALLLFAGAMLVRTATKQALMAQAAESGAAAGSPDAALRAVADEVARLLAELPRMKSQDEAMHAIVERIGVCQRTHLVTFVEARQQLIARLGMGGYAELMDRFAGAERQINRSWSAAADGVYEESINCLNQADEKLRDTFPKLKRA